MGRRIRGASRAQRQLDRFASALGRKGVAGFVLGFVASLAASFAFAAFHEHSPPLFAFSATILVLGFCLNLLLAHVRWLALQLTQARPASGPKEMVITDLLRSLSRYGLLRTQRQMDEAVALSANFKYLRGQNFLNLLREGFVTAKETLRILNDHPFSPFGEAVRPVLSGSVKVEAINAIPDELYDVSLLDDRIRLATEPNVTYWLLPAEDIHLSLIVFDGDMALVYATPANRMACDYAEALYTDDSSLVALLIKAFEVVRQVAEKAAAARDPEAILRSARRVAVSAQSHETYGPATPSKNRSEDRGKG